VYGKGGKIPRTGCAEPLPALQCPGQGRWSDNKNAAVLQNLVRWLRSLAAGQRGELLLRIAHECCDCAPHCCAFSDGWNVLPAKKLIAIAPAGRSIADGQHFLRSGCNVFLEKGMRPEMPTAYNHMQNNLIL
jgi:hypothetical protein